VNCFETVLASAGWIFGIKFFLLNLNCLADIPQACNEALRDRKNLGSHRMRRSLSTW